MSACGRCGHDNAEGAKFCNECAAPLVVAAAEVRKTVTVVFCDLVGSTALGESVDPEVLRTIMGRYHARLREVLEDHGGTVEKFVGDAAMAIFGIPRIHEDDALRAVRAAVLMRDAAQDLGLQVRIGVNTGEVVVGTGETLATGDPVNVAARLEQSASVDTILVGAQTEALVRDHVALEPVEPLTLKGKAEPVPAYLVAGLRHAEAGDDLEGVLVGRDHEMSLLEDACRLAAEKRVPQLVTVAGQPGVGKSRLVAELLERTDCQHLVGHCLSYGDGITWWPLGEVLDQLGDLRELLAGDPGAGEVVARLEAARGVAGAVASPEEIAWAFRRVLESLARDRLVILVLDDVHWAEPPMLDLVEHVTSFTRDASLVVLCTARPELFEARPSWAAPRANATILQLDSLTPEQAAALVHELHDVVDDEVVLRIVEAADGNPLFVQQLVAMHRETPGAGLEVPPSLQALLAARIDRLGPEERMVVERAAVEGRVFHRGAVTRLLPPVHRSDAGRSLVGLVRRDLVRPDRATVHGDDGFRFGHVLIRDAAYDAIAKRLRADLHEQYADWLVERLGDGAPQEIVGHHLERAHAYLVELGEERIELRDRAAEVLASAARSAKARRDMTAARTLFDRALVLSPDEPLRRHLLLDLVPVLVQMGDPRAEQILEEVRTRAEAAADLRTGWLAAVYRANLVTSTVARGPEETVATAERLLAEVPEDEHEVRALAWRLIADVHNLRGHAAETLAALDRALEHARAGSHRALEIDLAHEIAGPILYGPVPGAEGRRRITELVDRVGGDLSIQALARHLLAHLDAREGRFEGARETIDDWRQHFRELGQERRYGSLATCAWDIAWLTGDLAHGEAALREGYEILERIGDRYILCTMAAILGEAVYARGDLDEAERLAALSAEMGTEEDVQNEGLWRSVAAGVRAHRGDFAEAIRMASEAVELAAGTEETELEAGCRDRLAQVLELAGDRERAVAATRAALALYERKGNLVAAGWMRDRIERLAPERPYRSSL